MNRAAFWKIIGDARSGSRDDEVFLERVTMLLRNLSAGELLEFQRHFHELHEHSYGWRLWGAAYLMNGGCSDDGFEYFRAWLIAQGEQVFDGAIANPDSLAELAHAGGELEQFMYVAPELHRERTGREMAEGAHRGAARQELGEGWDFDDPKEMRRRYPKLFAKYGYGR